MNSSTLTDKEKESQARWAAASGFFGAIAEYYDFALYAPAATLLFAPLFFEPLGPAAGLMASFASFGVAYLVRPVGALIFGSLGDTKGRKPVLMATLTLMGTATFLIGCLPTYATAGIIAPILLVLLRVCQGLAAGIEQSGSGTLSAEHAPKKKRGIYTSWTMIGVAIGWFLGPAVMAPIAANESFLMANGWRIPFLLALPLVLFALWVRSHVTEPTTEQKNFSADDDASPQHTQADLVEQFGYDPADLDAHPLKIIVKYHLGNLVRVFFASFHMLVGVTANTFVIGYAVHQQGLDKSGMLAALSFAGLVTAFMQPGFAWLSDKVGRKPVFVTSCFGLALSLPLVMLSLHTGNYWFVAVVLTLFYVVVMAGNVVQASFYPELFPANVRFTGVSVGTQLGLIVVGFSPMIYQAVTIDAPFGWWPGALFAGVCWVLAGIAASTAKPVTGGK